MTRKIHTVSRTLILGAGICIAGATMAEPREPISIAALEEHFQQGFDAADTDQSGTLDLAEFAAAELPGRRMAGHHRQGKHPLPGWRGHGMRHAARARGANADINREGLRAARRAEEFAIMDEDADGNLSKAEYQAGDSREVRREALKTTAFKSMDVNQDELLTIDELTGRLAWLRAADADNDGYVSRDEMRAKRPHAD